MTALIPNRLLFDFEFPLRYRAAAATLDGGFQKWTDEFLLPKLGGIDGRTDFAEVWAAWNERGLYVACRVSGKHKPLRCDPKSFWTGDNLRLCTDMRDARNIKRATRFCQQFYFLPTGGGPRKNRAVGGVNKFQRAREEAPPIDASRLFVASEVTPTGYHVQAHIPVECLPGFDPAEHPRIGFYYMLEDADHGQQYLTVGDDLYWYVDPSTWATAVLTRDQ
jgi:hypothetical protein